MPPESAHREGAGAPGHPWAAAATSIAATAVALARHGYGAVRRRLHDLGLPAKLLLLTAAFVMLAEVLIFLPSVANYRIAWLTDRLTAAELAALAAGAVPGGDVPDTLRSDLFRTAQVKAVAMRQNGRRRLVLAPEHPLVIDAIYDLRTSGDGFWRGITRRIAQSRDAIAPFVSSGDRVLRVMGPHGSRPDDFIEIVLPEAPLKAAMMSYGLNVLALSVFISLVTAALVYLTLLQLLVRPMQRITRSMVQFRQNPEDASHVMVPSGRGDEIGTAERELADMQKQLAQALLQKNRLAQLGLAVSKINHDLRNMLANAQLISDRLASVPDPTVQRFVPKLIASLDRAITFCNSSLSFGRAEEAAPRREVVPLAPLVDEVGDGLGLPRDGQIAWRVDMPSTLLIDADREHLLRILSNLVRNAVQALETAEPRVPGSITVTGRREGRRVLVEVSDSGPGLPPRARAGLFQAFKGSSKKGGTGLGLTIAAELAAAHGGRLTLLERTPGATFLLDIPDRPTRADG